MAHVVPVRKLDHGVVYVSDLETANGFYRDVIGAEVIERGNGRWAYRIGSELLSVHGHGSGIGPFARIPIVPGNSDFCFEWDGPIQTAVEHLARHDVEVELGPIERFGARGTGTSVYFRDPDGSLMEFISYERSTS